MQLLAVNVMSCLVHQALGTSIMSPWFLHSRRLEPRLPGWNDVCVLLAIRGSSVNTVLLGTRETLPTLGLSALVCCVTARGEETAIQTLVRKTTTIARDFWVLPGVPVHCG